MFPIYVLYAAFLFRPSIYLALGDGNLQLFGKFQPFVSQLFPPKCYRFSLTCSHTVQPDASSTDGEFIRDGSGGGRF